MRLATLPSCSSVLSASRCLSLSLALRGLLLLLATPAHGAVSFDFSAYPESTRSCLETSADGSGCGDDDDATATEVNRCLCNNTGNFVLDSASCIGTQGDDIMTQVYDIMQESCSDTKTPLSVSEAEWLAAPNASRTTITSTFTTTSSGRLTVVTTTSTSINVTAATATATATSTSSSSSSDDDDDDDDDDGITTSAKIGAITSSIGGALTLACVICLVIFLRKRRKDKELIREAREARSRRANNNNNNDKPLLSPGGGYTTPASATCSPDVSTFYGASIVPPTPSHHQHQDHWSQATELSGEQRAYELHDHHQQQQQQQRGAGSNNNNNNNNISPGCCWPSPGTATWCPSPVSNTTNLSPSNALVQQQQQQYGPIPTTPTATGATGPLSRQLTTRSSWAHVRPPQEEPYELPGSEVAAAAAVEVDSVPLPPVRAGARPQRPARPSLHMAAAIGPPEYSPGGWVDPNTDKPPLGFI